VCRRTPVLVLWDGQATGEESGEVGVKREDILISRSVVRRGGMGGLSGDQRKWFAMYTSFRAPRNARHTTREDSETVASRHGLIDLLGHGEHDHENSAVGPLGAAPFGRREAVAGGPSCAKTHRGRLGRTSGRDAAPRWRGPPSATCQARDMVRIVPGGCLGVVSGHRPRIVRSRKGRPTPTRRRERGHR